MILGDIITFRLSQSILIFLAKIMEEIAHVIPSKESSSCYDQGRANFQEAISFVFL